MSPTQRTLKALRDQGYRVVIVEKWNPHVRQKQDLYGCIDILGIGNGETIAVQCTDGSNLSKRVKKITEHESLADMRDAGWRIECWGWRKLKTGWAPKIVDLS